MYRNAYELYVSTFNRALAALRSGDEQRLHSICAEVADLGGLASTVSMMALSDAECGRRQRSRSNVAGMFWRNTAAHGALRASYRGSAGHLGEEARAA